MSKEQQKKFHPFMKLVPFYKGLIRLIKKFENEIPYEDAEEEHERIKKTFAIFQRISYFSMLVQDNCRHVENIEILPMLTWLKNKQKFVSELSLEVLFHQFGFPKFDYECNLKQKVQLSDIIGFLEEEFLQAPEITDALLHARLLNNVDKERKLRLCLTLRRLDSPRLGTKLDHGQVARLKDCLQIQIREHARVYADDVKAYAARDKQIKRLEKVRHTRPSKSIKFLIEASPNVGISFIILAALGVYFAGFGILFGLVGALYLAALPAFALTLLIPAVIFCLLGGFSTTGAFVTLGLSAGLSKLRHHYNDQLVKSKNVFNKVKNLEASYELIHEMIPSCEQELPVKTMDGSKSAYQPPFSVKEALKTKRYESLNQLDDESVIQPRPGEIVIFR